MTDVCYVSYRHVEDDLDIPLALAAFERAGLSSAVVAWDEADHDWSQYGLVLLRSPWDYATRYEPFLLWAVAVDRVARLANPLSTLKWNTDKKYLRHLHSLGVPTVPTWFVGPGESPESSVLAAFDAADSGAVVVKPTISGGARHTFRVADVATASDHAAQLVRSGRVAMLQPYLAQVDDDEGEVSVLVIDGEISHAVTRVPALTQGGYGHAAGPVEVTAELRAIVGQTLEAAAEPDLLYARVDVVRDDTGQLVLMELELTEPSLFLPEFPAAADRLAAAVGRRIG
jgi:glutathione synthase/RimK-type ligase-like ATP-grasp enzyme